MGFRGNSNTGAGAATPSAGAATPAAGAATPAAGAATPSAAGTATPAAGTATPADTGSSIVQTPQQNAKRNINEPIQVIFKDINGNPITATVTVGEVSLSNKAAAGAGAGAPNKPSTLRRVANAFTRSSLGGKKARRITRKNKKSNKRRAKR